MRYFLLLSAVFLLASCAAPPRQPKRFGSVISLRSEKEAEYRSLHKAVWPEVMSALHEAHIRNYSIYLRRLPDGNLYLFSYLEYAGNDYASDMRKLAANPKVKEWWKLTDPCQQPLSDSKPGEWWAAMEEVSHLD